MVETTGAPEVPDMTRLASNAEHLSVIEGGRTNTTFATLVALAFAYEVSLTTSFEASPVIR